MTTGAVWSGAAASGSFIQDKLVSVEGLWRGNHGSFLPQIKETRVLSWSQLWLRLQDSVNVELVLTWTLTFKSDVGGVSDEDSPGRGSNLRTGGSDPAWIHRGCPRSSQTPDNPHDPRLRQTEREMGGAGGKDNILKHISPRGWGYLCRVGVSDSPVLTGKLGMSWYLKVCLLVAPSASRPSPEPQITATFGRWLVWFRSHSVVSL